MLFYACAKRKKNIRVSVAHKSIIMRLEWTVEHFIKRYIKIISIKDQRLNDFSNDMGVKQLPQWSY